MLNIFLASARMSIGGKILLDLSGQLFPTQQPTPLKDANYQSFCDDIARANGISKKILVGQDNGESPSGVGAYNEGDLKTKNPQIIIAKDRLSDTNDIKFAIAHELGHLREHHGLIIQSILIVNIALYAIPIIPIKYACATTIFSLISMVPIFRCMERRADDFAFANCPEEVIRGAFRKDTPIPTGFSSYLFGGNIEKRKETIQSHSKNK
ncbi:MAG TPA: M48 family metalloprotease [Chlamydiales bacterium]|nr:M48 family metalloprotease [Chlamydiales bacterium]